MNEQHAQGHSIASAMGLTMTKFRVDGTAKCRRELLLDIFTANRGKWFTLYELCALVGGSQTGTSAKARDLRKPLYGGHNIEAQKKPGTKNTWEYRLP